jgi:hypothetical protein
MGGIVDEGSAQCWHMTRILVSSNTYRIYCFSFANSLLCAIYERTIRNLLKLLEPIQSYRPTMSSYSSSSEIYIDGHSIYEIYITTACITDVYRIQPFLPGSTEFRSRLHINAGIY